MRNSHDAFAERNPKLRFHKWYDGGSPNTTRVVGDTGIGWRSYKPKLARFDASKHAKGMAKLNRVK